MAKTNNRKNCLLHFIAHDVMEYKKFGGVKLSDRIFLERGKVKDTKGELVTNIPDRSYFHRGIATRLKKKFEKRFPPKKYGKQVTRNIRLDHATELVVQTTKDFQDIAFKVMPQETLDRYNMDRDGNVIVTDIQQEKKKKGESYNHNTGDYTKNPDGSVYVNRGGKNNILKKSNKDNTGEEYPSESKRKVRKKQEELGDEASYAKIINFKENQLDKLTGQVINQRKVVKRANKKEKEYELNILKILENKK